MLMDTCSPKKKRRYSDTVCQRSANFIFLSSPSIPSFTMKSFFAPLAVVAFVASTVSAQTFTINSL